MTRPSAILVPVHTSLQVRNRVKWQHLEYLKRLFLLVLVLRKNFDEYLVEQFGTLLCAAGSEPVSYYDPYADVGLVRVWVGVSCCGIGFGLLHGYW